MDRTKKRSFVNNIKSVFSPKTSRKHSRKHSRKSAKASKPVHVESIKDIPALKALFQNGNDTVMKIKANWCGHCDRYKPIWIMIEKTPGRTMNIASVDESVLPHIPEIAGAKIKGYPSVIKVKSDGSIESYKDDEGEGETNAISDIRNVDKIRAMITSPSKVVSSAAANNVESKKASRQVGIEMSGGFAAESIFGTLVSAVQQAAPALLLATGYSMLPTSSFKSPKRQTRRASTRKNRRS